MFSIVQDVAIKNYEAELKLNQSNDWEAIKAPNNPKVDVSIAFYPYNLSLRYLFFTTSFLYKMTTL
jgi:hypothetical protein